MNRYYSPTTMTLLQAWHSALNWSSIGTGATFSPPAVIISSLILPVIFKNRPSNLP